MRLFGGRAETSKPRGYDALDEITRKYFSGNIRDLPTKYEREINTVGRIARTALVQIEQEAEAKRQHVIAAYDEAMSEFSSLYHEEARRALRRL